MIVYINESKLPLLRESNEEVTFYEFFTKTKNFIKDLLSDPINAKPDNMFKAHGISRSTLLNKLLDRGIVIKKEDIKEPNDADGKMKSMHYIQYKVPKKNFEQKIKRLYQYFYDNFKKNEINESILDNVRPQKYNSAATYIFCKDRSGVTYVLAGKRRGNHEGGKYNVPTGQVGDKYYGESVLDAAAREVKEESGLDIPTSLFNDIGDEQYESRYGICLGKNYMVVLDGTIDEHKPGNGDGENDKFQWIPVTKIGFLPWAFGMDKKIYSIANTL